MPMFSDGWINDHWNRYSHLGPDLHAALSGLVNSPMRMAQMLMSDETRMRTLYDILLWSGFLCLLSPRCVVPLAIVLLPHLIANYPPQMALTHQYSSYVLPFVMLAICSGVHNGCLLLGAIQIPKRTQTKSFVTIICFAIGCMIFSWPKYIRSHDPQMVSSAHNVLERVPRHCSIAASSAYLPHLADRRDIELLFNTPRADVERMDYVMLDMYDPMPWPITNVWTWKSDVNWLLMRSSFGIYHRDGRILLLKRLSERSRNARVWRLVDQAFPGEFAGRDAAVPSQ